MEATAKWKTRNLKRAKLKKSSAVMIVGLTTTNYIMLEQKSHEFTVSLVLERTNVSYKVNGTLDANCASQHGGDGWRMNMCDGRDF
jgi:hypothetical protein